MRYKTHVVEKTDWNLHKTLVQGRVKMAGIEEINHVIWK